MKTLKNILIVLAVSGIFFYAVGEIGERFGRVLIAKATKMPITPLRIVVWKDISPSIKNKGISQIDNNTFQAIYQVTDRDIELNYGVIARTSARPLITLKLPAWKGTMPEKPDFSEFNLEEMKRVNNEYEQAVEKYKKDSIEYVAKRAASISVFEEQRKQLDSLDKIDTMKNGTDLETAMAVTDKAFNYSHVDGYSNYVILSSDGINSRPGTKIRLRNHATVILVNATKFEHTSIDSIITTSFQSIDQAISFILSTK